MSISLRKLTGFDRGIYSVVIISNFTCSTTNEQHVEPYDDKSVLELCILRIHRHHCIF